MAVPASFNEAQKRRIVANAEYADKLLGDIENILVGAEAGRLFRRHHPDVTPAQARLVRSSIAQFRRQLGRFLQAAAIDGESRRPRFGALHSILVTLAFVRIAMQEMAPEHLRGYGRLDPNAEAALRGVTNQLESMIAMLEAELRSGMGADLESRLARGPETGGIGALLRTLERIIREEDLPEFRPSLLRLVEKLESPCFELAVFGRVSSGKSSLLNSLLGANVLPVGVTPVTAVPVRILHGEAPELAVHFAGGRVEHLPVEQLPVFATEEQNPANQREVLRLIVRLPSPVLKDGLVFVDTPGLGSLATTGAAETLSYLPRCDLGLVLVSAVTPLNEEDLATVDLLVRANTPAMVLLSKADLLAGLDLERAMRYTASALRRELGVELPVAPVSVEERHAGLLEEWKQRSLQPVLERHRELAGASLRRKAHALRASVAAALRGRLEGAGGRIPRSELERTEDRLRRAAAGLEAARRDGMEVLDRLRNQGKQLQRLALEQILGKRLWRDSAACGEALRAAAVQVCDAAAEEIHHHLKQLCEVLSAALAEARHVMRPGSEPDGPGFSCEEIRGLPVPSLEVLPRPVRVPAAAGLPWAGRWIAAAALERQAGGALWRVLEAYARSLESWLLRQLELLQQRFDAEAGVFRAEIARLLSAGPVEAGHQARLQQWLEELDRAAEAPAAEPPQDGDGALTPTA
jgi:GTP-binding protein EngB required for normal cell division